MKSTLWFNTFYQENFALVAIFLIALGIPLFIFRNTKTHFQASWASVKSWLYILPLFYFFFGLPQPGPMIFMVLVAIYSSKRFFQMTGMYHRSFFVYVCYTASLAAGYCIYKKYDMAFFSSSSLLLFVLTLIPVLMNKTKNMIQYVSLTFVCFCLFSWNVLLGARLFEVEKGIYLLFYLYALAEFSVNTTNGISLMFPSSSSVAGNISLKPKWGGLICSFLLTVLLAWGFRRLLFDTSEKYWIAASLLAFWGAHLGEWGLSTFRKDSGMKNQGVFIIGRGDILNRTNHIIYVYPFYTIYLWTTGDLTFFANL